MIDESLFIFDEPTATVNNNNNDERKTTRYIYIKCAETEKIYNDAIERKGRIRKIEERNRIERK